MRLIDLFETYDQQHGELSKNQEAVLPPVIVVKDLNNSNNYQQYRFNVDMASARAVAAGEVPYKQVIPWVQYLTIVGYTPQDIETIRLAAKQAGYDLDEINSSPSREPDWVNKVSPVANIPMTESRRRLREEENVARVLSLIHI